MVVAAGVGALGWVLFCANLQVNDFLSPLAGRLFCLRPGLVLASSGPLLFCLHSMLDTLPMFVNWKTSYSSGGGRWWRLSTEQLLNCFPPLRDPPVKVLTFPLEFVFAHGCVGGFRIVALGQDGEHDRQGYPYLPQRVD